jgi:hypothetical protein
LTLESPIMRELVETAHKAAAEAWAKEYGSMIDQFNQQMAEVTKEVNAQETQLAELKQAVDALKLTDEEKRQQWLVDRPANSATQPVTYRPRTDRRSEQGSTVQSSDQIAAGTLARLPK